MFVYKDTPFCIGSISRSGIHTIEPCSFLHDIIITLSLFLIIVFSLLVSAQIEHNNQERIKNTLDYKYTKMSKTDIVIIIQKNYNT